LTKEETAQLLAYLASAFPSVTIRRENAEVYHLHLSPLDFAKCKAAADVLISTAKWFPSIAQIKDQVAVSSGLLGPPFAIAWSEVLIKAQLHGRIAKPDFSHITIKETVNLIGWYNICMSASDTVRFQFQQVYEQKQQDLKSLTSGGLKEITDVNL